MVMELTPWDRNLLDKIDLTLSVSKDARERFIEDVSREGLGRVISEQNIDRDTIRQDIDAVISQMKGVRTIERDDLTLAQSTIAAFGGGTRTRTEIADFVRIDQLISNVSSERDREARIEQSIKTDVDYHTYSQSDNALTKSQLEIRKEEIVDRILEEIKSKQKFLKDRNDENTDGSFGSVEGEHSVRFQFPPHISSDDKKANWLTKDIRQAEPFAIFAGAEARKINLKWTYIAGAIGWKGVEVEKEIKNLRRFFYNRIGDDLIVKFRAYDIVGSAYSNNTWTFRSDGVNVKHSNTIVSSGATIYPLRTDVEMTLHMYTSIGFDQENENASQFFQNLSPLPDSIEWF